jgi:hypothetical protein
MVDFSTIKPGDILYECRRERMSNTAMRRMAVRTVRIISVDANQMTVQASWNGNSPSRWTERHLKKLRRTKPKIEPSIFNR